MRTTTAAVLAAALLLAGCGSQPSQKEVETACLRAIAHRADADRAKPEACKPLPQDGYEALEIAHRMRKTGIIDRDGNLDTERLTEDDLDP